MKTTLAVLLAAPLLVLSACAGDEPTTANDPAADPPADPPASQPAEPRPSTVPAAEGQVRTRDLATVMDTGKGPAELCLGPVAESYPPQCGGPELVGWDWSQTQGVFERQGKVRWGSFMVTGTWDGSRFTVEDAVPAALYSPIVTEPSPTPTPATTYTAEELQQVQREVQDLPGAQGAYVEGGQVVVDVTFDDGTIQAWADETYGEDVVLVRSQLVPTT
ncbi:hypothetical protein [Nocardioides sp. SYSU DS0663]|uniref:hypothetical protein n=1 Tax=Nocardioides sp. SYSU DS0663 TaxID=3416445 RepID=UPI003F4CA0F3